MRVTVTVTAVATASFGVTAPQAYAVDAVPAGGVRISDRADAATRAVAAAQPVAAAATANLCGAGYELTFAQQLPDSRRIGTLFTYSPVRFGRGRPPRVNRGGRSPWSCRKGGRAICRSS
ncbi:MULTISPECIES: hypothetical protein [Streptomyces]|uniref:hypothetical protein n=1 Tax=Streptomyces TaxID=1883 RepID=UPI00069EA460|nr:hypothetical protein [Streptomyces virginiae]